MEATLRQNAGVTLALAAAGVSTLWLTRSIWAYWIDCLMVSAFGLSKRKRDNIFLEGVYKPVKQEVHSQGLTVTGVLPRSLDGVFARIGPNPYFEPMGDYHLYVNRTSCLAPTSSLMLHD